MRLDTQHSIRRQRQMCIRAGCCKTKTAQPERVVAYYKGAGQHLTDGSDGDDTALQLALVEEEEEPVVQPEKKKAKRSLLLPKKWPVC